MVAADPPIYTEALLLLGGAVVSAPLFKRIGLGTVLGYLAAGVVIGPIARFITGGEEILSVAELGVVFLLFIIGLELKPTRLWALRRDIFGLGLVQVPRYRVAAQLASGELVNVLADTPPPTIPVSVLYPQARQLSARVRVFADWLIERFRQS